MKAAAGLSGPRKQSPGFHKRWYCEKLHNLNQLLWKHFLQQNWTCPRLTVLPETCFLPESTAFLWRLHIFILAPAIPQLHIVLRKPRRQQCPAAALDPSQCQGNAEHSRSLRSATRYGATPSHWASLNTASSQQGHSLSHPHHHYIVTTKHQ